MKSPYIIMAIAFTAIAFSGCSSGEKGGQAMADTIAKPAATPVFELQRRSISSEISLPAELAGFKQVDLFAKVNSYVKTLQVDIGSEVKEGQVLVVLEAPEISSQLAAAASRLHSQEAVYEASSSTYKRLLETSKVEGTISKNDLEVAFSRQKSDNAQLQAARAAYREVRVTQSYLVIRAPFTGKITGRNINTGAYIAQGATVPMLTIQDQRKLRLAISVPEDYTGYLKTGDSLSFTVNALKGELFKAKISRMSGALDSRLRAERVELDVDNRHSDLLPGMVAEVKLPLKSRKMPFVVQKTAVMSTSEGVFVIRVENGKAKRVKVEQGLTEADDIEIYSDELKVADKLITKASEEIRENSAVHMQ